ncbi:MAG: hypothetical protein GY778_21765 [bacterium]|nr:hypothetical protein [bacterium]
MRTTLKPTMFVLTLAAAISGCGDSLAIQSRSFQTRELQSARTVAVVDFAGDSGGQAIADMLTMHLMKAGYQIVERDNLRRVIDEQKMGSADQGKLDLTETERLSLIGRNITADLVITGELVRLVPARYERESDDRVKFPPATCEVTARAIDTKTGRVIWTCVVNVTATAKNGQHILPLDYVNEACLELVTSLKDPNYGNKSETYKGAEIDAMRRKRPWKT